MVASAMVLNETGRHINISYHKPDPDVGVQFWQQFTKMPEWVNKHLYIVPFSIGILANSVLFVYFYKSGKYRVPIFTLLTSLTLCDWFISVTTVFNLTAVHPQVAFVPGADVVCRLVLFILTASFAANICHMMLLAAVRYYQLVHPLSAKVRVTSGWVLRWCLGIWSLCCLLNIPYPIYYTVIKHQNLNTTVGIFQFIGNFEAKEIGISLFAQILPLVVIGVLHVLKIFKVTKLPKDGTITETTEQQKRRSASSRTVMILIIVFCITIVPRLAHTLYHTALGYPNQPFHRALFIHSNRFSYANAFLDPFVYLLGSSEIRLDIVRTLWISKSTLKR